MKVEGPGEREIDREFLLGLHISEDYINKTLLILNKNDVNVDVLLTFSSLDELASLRANENGEEVSMRVGTIRLLWRYIVGETASAVPTQTLHKVTELSDGILGFVAFEVPLTDLKQKGPHLGSEQSNQEQVVKFGRKLWGEGRRPKSVWLRECYFELYRIVRAKLECEVGTVMLAGSCGVGKSVFGLLVVMNLVSEGKVVMYEHKGRRMLIVGNAVSSDHRTVLTRCLEKVSYSPIDDGVYRFAAKDETLWKSLLDQENFVVVQDLGDFQGGKISRHGGGRKIIIPSPGDEQLSQLHSEIGVLHLVIPPWTEAELLLARAKCYEDRKDLTEVYVKEAFRKYGGISRFVLEFRKYKIERMLREALRDITIAQLAQTCQAKGVVSLPSMKATGYFAHLAPEPYEGAIEYPLGDTKLDELSRKYRRFRCVPGSQHLLELLVNRFMKDEPFLQQQLARPIPAAPPLRGFYGLLLEAHGHRVLQKGGTRSLIMLADGVDGLTSIELPEMRPRHAFPGRKGLKDVKRIRSNEYIRPAIPGYPTWDSLTVLKNSAFRPDGLVCPLFQFTRGTQYKPVIGGVVKETQEAILKNLVVEELTHDKSARRASLSKKRRAASCLPSPSFKKWKKEKDEQLEMIMVCATTKKEIKIAQPVLNTDGKEYKAHSGHKPKLAQYAMIMDETFDRLAQIESSSKQCHEPIM